MVITRSENTLTLYGYIFEGDGVWFSEEFGLIDGVFPTINIRLHTMGGSVFDGNLMYNLLQRSKSKIIFYIDGLAASMGDVLLGAADEIYMAKNAFLMKHAPSGYTYGTAQEHKNTANLLLQIEDNFVKDWIRISSKPESEVKKWLVGDNWFSATEALKEGLITGIIDPVIDIDLKEEIENDSANLNAKYIGGRFDALLVAGKKPTNLPTASNNQYKYMKKELITALGLTGVNEQSSDTAFVTAVQQKVAAETQDYKAKYEAEKKAHDTLKETVQAGAKQQVKDVVAQAVKEGKIQASDTEVYESIGEKSGLESLQTVLGAKTARKPIQTTAASSSSVAASTTGEDWDTLQKTPQGRKKLQEMAKEDPEGFSALYEAKYNVKPQM